MKVYKIRNKNGLFSTGGTTPRWKKKGKTWTSFQYVQAHLNMICKYCEKYKYLDPYVNCVVVEYSVTENLIYDIVRRD